MRQRRRPPSCELGQLRPLQQIAQFVAAQAAVLHQAALARGYLSGADTHNTKHISHILCIKESVKHVPNLVKQATRHDFVKRK